VPVEFLCEGCGCNIVAVALTRPPAHGFCAVCLFINDYVKEPQEFDAICRAMLHDRRRAPT
jgi:hypothetical protein